MSLNKRHNSLEGWGNLKNKRNKRTIAINLKSNYMNRSIAKKPLIMFYDFKNFQHLDVDLFAKMKNWALLLLINPII